MRRYQNRRPEGVQMLRDDYTRAEVARLLGVKWETVNRWAVEEGIAPRRGKPGVRLKTAQTFADRRRDALLLLESGKCICSVADALKVPDAVVREWRDSNAERRQRGQSILDRSAVAHALRGVREQRQMEVTR